MQQIQTDGQAKLTALASDLQNLQSKLNAAKTKEDKDKIEADMQAKSESLESERQSINVKLSFAQQSHPQQVHVRVEEDHRGCCKEQRH